ncbi:MAG TPA: glycosyltransferase family 2 protein [Candidatus Eisenbacteria bacterium]|nr:glycosyltransferase family 2 protein [Candidatus Eisenbacteria bacterium]
MSLPPWCQSALLLLTAVSALFWLGGAMQLYGGVRRLRGLEEVEPLPDDALPAVTIVAAAKDEAVRAEQAARSLLKVDYPGLEIVIVDDRSTDGTGAILDRVALEDSRLRVLHVTSLPEGWIGKCHALARGEEAARGAWLLFTDGDVVLGEGALRRAVSYALEAEVDHLAVGLDADVEGLGEAIFIGYFLAIFFITQRPWNAPDPRSRDHIGIGAFNLVRRDAYERAGGHAELRMELLDDLALGAIVKRSGGKSLFALPDGMVRTRWHTGVRGLIRGVEKNAFAGLDFRPWYAAYAVTMQIVASLVPLAGLLFGDTWTRAFAFLAWSGVFLVYATTANYAQVRWWQAIFMPLGGLLFGYAIARSTVLALRRGGIVWRGTFYPLSELRKGRAR